MGKRHKKSKHDSVTDRTRAMYLSWKKIYCPALKADVQFTRFGWEHLCVKKWRTSRQEEERMNILPLAKKLIGLTTTIQSVRWDEFKIFEFNAILGGSRITALVSKTKEGFIFLSNFKD